MESPARTGAQRIDSLDGLRGIACLSVLILHIGIMLLPFGENAPYGLVPGTAAVMVFYVLSGVVLSLVPFRHMEQRKENPEQAYAWFGYFPRRVARLCVPLFAAIALGVIAGFVAHTIGDASRSATSINFDGEARQIIHDLFMQFDMLFNVSDDGVTLYGMPLERVDSPVWSMSWELWFSLTLPLCICVVMAIKKDVIAVAVIAVLIFISHYSTYFPLRLCLMFVLGIILAKHQKQLMQAKLPVVLEALCLIVGIVAIEAPIVYEGSAFVFALLSTVANMACMGIVVIAMTDGFFRAFLSTTVCKALGTISYSMYLTHAIVIGALRALLPHFGISIMGQVGIAFVLSFVFAWVFWYFVERPSITWSHKVGKAASAFMFKSNETHRENQSQLSHN